MLDDQVLQIGFVRTGSGFFKASLFFTNTESHPHHSRSRWTWRGRGPYKPAHLGIPPLLAYILLLFKNSGRVIFNVTSAASNPSFFNMVLRAASSPSRFTTPRWLILLRMVKRRANSLHIAAQVCLSGQ